MTREERRRTARVLINGTGHQFRKWSDVITVYLPDRLCRAPYDGGAAFVRAYHEVRKRQSYLARTMIEAATVRQARAKAGQGRPVRVTTTGEVRARLQTRQATE